MWYLLSSHSGHGCSLTLSVSVSLSVCVCLCVGGGGGGVKLFEFHTASLLHRMSISCLKSCIHPNYLPINRSQPAKLAKDQVGSAHSLFKLLHTYTFQWKKYIMATKGGQFLIGPCFWHPNKALERASVLWVRLVLRFAQLCSCFSLSLMMAAFRNLDSCFCSIYRAICHRYNMSPS